MGAMFSKKRKHTTETRPPRVATNGQRGPRLWRRGSSPCLVKQPGKFRSYWRAPRGEQMTKLSVVETDEEERSASSLPTPSPSPMLIRQQKLRTLEETRPTLSANQKSLLRNTWNVIQHHTRTVGYDMFNRLFRTYPDLHSAFPKLKVLDPKEAAFKEEVIHHGSRVLDTLEGVLLHIDDQDHLVQHVHELGRKHVAYNAKIDYIDLIGPQFLFAVEPILFGYWNAEVEQAWAQLFKVIGHIMKEAMLM